MSAGACFEGDCLEEQRGDLGDCFEEASFSGDLLAGDRVNAVRPKDVRFKRFCLEGVCCEGVCLEGVFLDGVRFDASFFIRGTANLVIDVLAVSLEDGKLFEEVTSDVFRSLGELLTPLEAADLGVDGIELNGLEEVFLGEDLRLLSDDTTTLTGFSNLCLEFSTGLADDFSVLLLEATGVVTDGFSLFLATLLFGAID